MCISLTTKGMDLMIIFLIMGLFANFYCEGGDLEYDGKLNIKLEHSLDNTPSPVYIYRGEIFIESLHSGVAYIDESITKEQILLLKNLASEGGNYRLRATAKTNEGKENHYYTFVKASSLIDSYLNNIISVNLDHSGNVIAVLLSVPNKSKSNDSKRFFPSSFNTSVELRHMELGPSPDTATYILKLEREREAKERGDIKDNRSFLGKYWMYIVPVVIFMLLPSATNPDSGVASSQR